MRKRPNEQDEVAPPEEELEEGGSEPLPDRTRIEQSPFLEQAPPRARPRHSPRSSPSVIVDQQASGRAPPRRRPPPRASRPQPEPDPDLESWDAPAGEVADATRVEPLPSSRPPPRRHERPRSEPEEDWGPPPPVDDANATRLAPVPTERPRRDSVEDQNATQAGPPISLDVVEGPDVGMRLPVRGGRMIVGRGDGCDFKLKDGAASRRHAEVVNSPSGLVVRDLGSGNGTRVNGERVTEAVAVHGDRISLGQTVLRVVDELKQLEEERERKAAVSRPPPRQAPPRRSSPPPRAVEADGGDGDEAEGPSTSEIVLPRSRRPAGGLVARFRALPRPMRLTVAGGGGLLALLLLFALAGALRPPPPPPGPPPEELEYGELFEQGKQLLRVEKHAEALEKFKAAQAIFDKPELKRYIDTCERDGKAARVLVEAKALAAGGEHQRAIELLRSIDNLSSSFDEAKQLTGTYERDRVQALQKSIDAALEGGDVEGARTLAEGLPEEEAAAARRRIDEAEIRLAADAKTRQRLARESAARAKREKLRKARAEVDEAVAGVVRKIDSGNFEGAQRELDRVMEGASSKYVVAKARELRKLIPQFAAAYREGESKYRGGSYEAAATPLLRALTLYEDMDIDGKLAGSLQEKVAKSMEMKGRAALARQEYGKAAKAFREAVRFNPKAIDAKAGLQEIARKAKEVYLEGYVEKDRNPDLARRKFHEVLEMVGPDNESYQDAKRRLEDLETR